MSLKQKITDDMKTAMRAGEIKKRDTIRLLQAAIKQKEVDERIEIDDTVIIAIIEKMIKQRKDSIAHYETAKRHDLATAEQDEIDILSTYMPPALSDDEVDALVTAAVNETGAKNMQDMGKIMAVLKPRIAGRTDMARVSALIKAKISG
jgi:uncharacterized protein